MLLPICVEFVRTWGYTNRVWDLCNISNEENKHGGFILSVYRFHTIDIYFYPVTEISKKIGEVKKNFPFVAGYEVVKVDVIYRVRNTVLNYERTF